MRLNFKSQKPLTQEEASQKDIQFAVENTKLQLSSDILATKKSLAEKKEEIEVVKTTYPFDTARYINLSVEIEGLEDGLKRIETIQKEFGF